MTIDLLQITSKIMSDYFEEDVKTPACDTFSAYYRSVGSFSFLGEGWVFSFDEKVLMFVQAKVKEQ